MSHGSTLRVAKLTLASTILPLLIAGAVSSAGDVSGGSRWFNLTRDIFRVSGLECPEADIGELFRLFLGSLVVVLFVLSSSALLLLADSDDPNVDDRFIVVRFRNF